MKPETGSSADLTWLLDDLVDRVEHARHVAVLSKDGLPIAASSEFTEDDGKYLAAAAAGLQSLAGGAGARFAGGPVQATTVEWQSMFLLVTAAGQGALLALLAGDGVEVGPAVYEMITLAARLPDHLATPPRSDAEATVGDRPQ